MSAATVFALTVLPDSIMQTHWFSALSGFVAINTILYVSLSIFKIMPKVYLNDFLRRRGRRAETRGIYPNGKCAPLDYEPAPDSLAALQWARTHGPRGFSFREVVSVQR